MPTWDEIDQQERKKALFIKCSHPYYGAKWTSIRVSPSQQQYLGGWLTSAVLVSGEESDEKILSTKVMNHDALCKSGIRGRPLAGFNSLCFYLYDNSVRGYSHARRWTLLARF